MAEDGSVKYSWFRTEFDVPGEWTGEQVLLNFQAVDYEATVFVNVCLSKLAPKGDTCTDVCVI